MKTNIPEAIEPVLDRRPEAAFFEPTASYMFDFSRGFYLDTKFLMPEGFGVVASFGQPSDSPLDSIPPIESLHFDGRGHSEGHYSWQICHGNEGQQRVWQVDVSEGHIEGTYFGTDRQGRLLRDIPLVGETLSSTLDYLANLVGSDEVLEAIAATKSKKKRAIRDVLEHVARIRDGEIFHPSALASKKTIAQHTGFTALKPYAPKRSLAEDVVEEKLAVASMATS
ncbi:MAG TPA: hypothetical protein VL989_01345 [Candidatus Sulfotelmatobacter sp.]|nr:hypothetical protein [Candidatus Sulfotelmatobacter sp.]